MLILKWSGKSKKETKPNARYNIDSKEYENSFISKPVLRSEYGTLFEHQGSIMQELCRMYLFVTLKLPKEMHLLLDLPPHLIVTIRHD